MRACKKWFFLHSRYTWILPGSALLVIALATALASADMAASTDSASEALYQAPPPSEYDIMRQRRGGKVPEGRLGERGFVSQGLRTLLVLAFIIAVVYLSLRLLRRFMGKGILKGSGKEIVVLARTYLEPKRTLCIVQVGQRFFLVGTSEQGMVLLAELAAEDVGTVGTAGTVGTVGTGDDGDR